MTVRLVKPEELEQWNTFVDAHHYLSSKLVGPTLRYVAEAQGQWLGLLSFGQAAYHLADRDHYIGWTDVQRGRRLSMIGQNSRFVLLCEQGAYPNLASRIMSQCLHRISADWQDAFGPSFVAVETFVDPQFFQGTCYKASGWERLGQTSGYGRARRDFYQQHDRPKEIWFKVLDRRGMRSLKSKRLPARLKPFETEYRVCPFKAPSLESLFNLFQNVPDHRGRKGRRYRLATLLCIVTLAVLCGHTSHRAIASFSKKLTQKQRKRLRCSRNKDGTYRAPQETCIRNVLESLDAECVENVLIQWMAGLDEHELSAICIDGKTLKGTASRNEDGIKDGALHLVSAVSHDSTRLVAQEAVDDKSNEIPAVQRLIERIPHLDGITVTADAMHCLNENAHLIGQKKGAITTSG